VRSRTFIDSVALHVRSGNGGDGCASFRREKYVPKGGPDGGDGGRGGHVIVKGDKSRDSLEAFHYAPNQFAENGERGKGKMCHGRNGKDLTACVPCGTEVRDLETNRLIGDIVEDGQTLTVARGGKGGLGNCHWKSSTRRAPREHSDGGRGEEVSLQLDLKLIADIGLVGFPNAGKSSLLTALSDAHPKVAAYPFTTLHPIMGTVIFDDYTRLRIADVPGLIKGAHEGVGLGDRFLRHIERSLFLLYVIDMAGVDGRCPGDDYVDLREELTQYKAELGKLPTIVVANKMDLPVAAENLREFKSKTGVLPISVSALTGLGLTELKDEIHKLASLNYSPRRHGEHGEEAG
jgi:GTP-binding protein